MGSTGNTDACSKAEREPVLMHYNGTVAPRIAAKINQWNSDMRESASIEPWGGSDNGFG